MKHLSRYCNMRQNIVTLIDIMSALEANVEVKNSVADMVFINWLRTKEFVHTNVCIIRKLIYTINYFEIR